jgi:hypothetical protein
MVSAVVVGAADLETFIPSPSSYFVILVTPSLEEYRLYNNSLSQICPEICKRPTTSENQN